MLGLHIFPEKVKLMSLSLCFTLNYKYSHFTALKSSKCYTEEKMWITIRTRYIENCRSKFKPDAQVMLQGKGAKI